MAPNKDWPVLTRYDQDHLGCIALPLGGIGTGTVSLGGRGNLRDWEVVNRPAKGFSPRHAFFALFARPAGGPAVTRVLEGAIPPPYEGASGCTTPNHGMPHFRQCSFAAAYPLGQVMLSDRDVPLDVRVEAFNPLVPGDADASGIPVAILRFVLTNKTPKTVAASVCGSLENFIGTDGSAGKPEGNVNTIRKSAKVSGVFMHSDGVDPAAEQFGTIALATTARGGVTASTRRPDGWGRPLLDFWDDFSADGKVKDPEPGQADTPLASLAVSVAVPPRKARAVTFILAWHFPNRRTWTPLEGSGCTGEGCCDPNRIGNYYTTRYADAWDVVARTAADLPRLEARTLGFVRSFCESDLPPVVKEAALFNLSTLRSQSCFRTEDGRFFGWEGCGDRGGCCHGSCTHVWNYEQATAFLFGGLSRGMRDTEFNHATAENGRMSFRVNLPIEHAQAFAFAAADGQMGCLMKLYRDWQLGGDDRWLASIWPQARRALEFCWIPGGWDADRDGVMEGCQHNTMDVEYFGPNPQMQAWYLGALRAGEEMARHAGDLEFAHTCRELFDRGSTWTDAHLFNGEYYEHEVRPPAGESAIAEGLRVGMGAKNLADPDFQLGAGCLVDQLVGQFVAHVCGLGRLLKAQNVRTTLRSIRKHNFRKDLFGHFNHLRTFALNDESALLMAAYPRGRRPKVPFPYFNEVMTGFEYAAAVGMLQEGLTAEGLECIEAIRKRYDGRRRNPFDEAECGHHYARAMASWAAVLALTGFHYSAVDGTLEFAAAGKPVRWFWSNGSAWGVCSQKPGRGKTHVEVKVVEGQLAFSRFVLTHFGQTETRRPVTLHAGKAMKLVVIKE